MDNELIKRFALFLFEENPNNSKQFDGMIARLDKIGKGLKEASHKIDFLTNSLLKANSKAEKLDFEYKPWYKEYRNLRRSIKSLLNVFL